MLPVTLRRAFVLASVLSTGSLVTLGGCSTDPCPNTDAQIYTHADDDVDFSEFETFAIAELEEGDLGMAGAGGASADIPDDVRLNLAIANDTAAEELADIGLEEVDPDEETPDLWVFSAGATEIERGIEWYCVPGWYLWWGYYDYLDPCAWLYPVEFEYTEGTLFVGVADSSTGAPVFAGLLQGVLECTADVEQSVEDGVAKIFEDYPIE